MQYSRHRRRRPGRHRTHRAASSENGEDVVVFDLAPAAAHRCRRACAGSAATSANTAELFDCVKSVSPRGDLPLRRDPERVRGEDAAPRLRGEPARHLPRPRSRPAVRGPATDVRQHHRRIRPRTPGSRAQRGLAAADDDVRRHPRSPAKCSATTTSRSGDSTFAASASPASSTPACPAEAPPTTRCTCTSPACTRVATSATSDRSPRYR